MASPLKPRGVKSKPVKHKTASKSRQEGKKKKRLLSNGHRSLYTTTSTPLALTPSTHSKFSYSSPNRYGLNASPHLASKRHFFGFGKKKETTNNTGLQPANTNTQLATDNNGDDEVYPTFLPPIEPPKNAFLRVLKRVKDQVHSESDNLGIMVGKDPDGNSFFEYREPWMSQQALPRRRVEFASGISTTTVHELWDGWLRHARKLPPSKDEFSRYNQRRETYLERVRQVEIRDAQLRQQEQLQAKLKGYRAAEKQDPASAQASVMDILTKMEEQLANQRARQAEMKVLQNEQHVVENGSAAVGGGGATGAENEEGTTIATNASPTASASLQEISTDVKNGNAV